VLLQLGEHQPRRATEVSRRRELWNAHLSILSAWADTLASMRMTIVIDCNDLDTQAAFWCAAADYRRLAGWVDFYVNLKPNGDDSGRPPILLQRVPEPKEGKNRLHIDFHPDDGPGTVARLVDLGASLIGPRNTEFLEQHRTQFQVMADPEGNEFCVVWRAAPTAWD
jgi:hypothetical protein